MDIKRGAIPNLDRIIPGLPTDSSSTTIHVNVTQNYYSTDSADGYPSRKDDQGKMKTFVVLMPGEDGYIVAECPALPGCISQGKTRAEAIENIKEAIQIAVESRKELGFQVFEDTIEVEV